MVKRTDSRKKSRHSINGTTLRKAVTWAISDEIFAQVKLHGNTSWNVADLVLLAVVWVWSGDATLTGAFAEAHHWSMKVLGRAAVGTFQGLLKALVIWTAPLLLIVAERLHELMEKHGVAHWRVGRWLALAVDGSRMSTARTLANEKAFCAPNFGGSATAKYRRKKRRKKGIRRRTRRKAKQNAAPMKPQIWVTLMWHMGLNMPWCWKTGPSNSSERDHFRTMLAERKFPANTLFCADAGFTGYELWKAILDAGHSFLIRVGANVTLLRKLGYVRERAGLVYFWPDKVARKKQPPLVLRLLQCQVGRCQVSLLTNVLRDEQLSDQEAIRLYKMRWGVELQFRTVKQTFGRRKLRSRTPQRAYVELDWSLMGLWLIQLFAIKEQIEIGEIPEHCSVSMAIHLIRTMLQRWSEHAEATFAKTMQTATKDSYKRKRSKQARYQPDYKDKPAAGSPKVVKATRQHKALLHMHLNNAA
jgi:hypothetical protein